MRLDDERTQPAEVAAERRVGHGALELLCALPAFALAPLFRHWHLRWGATDAEVAAPMAGDDIVAESTFTSTRAITIAAPPDRVWPWIVQMGYRRAGFYTYDLVDNAGYPSADHILEEYQTFAVGDRAFNMNGLFGIELPLNDSDAFRVKGFEANEWLLWEKPDSSWSWLRKALPGGRTRLIVRIKAHTVNIFWTLFMEFGDPPMAVRMLKGIKARAET
jgi:hypothetical protein